MHGVVSPRIQKFLSDLITYGELAECQFWQEIQENGAPIIERCEHSADQCFVTFVWKGVGIESNVVVSGFLNCGPADDPTRNRMTNISGTTVWYRTYQLPSDSAFAYYIVPNDPTLVHGDWGARNQFVQRDPFNPRVYQRYSDVPVASVVRLPDAHETPASTVTDTCAAPAGRLSERQFFSEILKNSRQVWMYTPHDFKSDTPYPLYIFFDGEAYLDVLNIQRTLDGQMNAGGIPKAIAAFVGNVDRTTRRQELSCNREFRTFIIDELIPWIRGHYNVSANPALTTLCGISLGALTASYIALSHPEILGNVISQSGSFWWSPEGEEEPNWVSRWVARSGAVPVRFYIEAGTFETNAEPRFNLLQANRQLRDVLWAKGYDLQYSEFHGGHDDQSWGYTVAQGLRALAELNRK